jgi:hypothetical protein
MRVENHASGDRFRKNFDNAAELLVHSQIVRLHISNRTKARP